MQMRTILHHLSEAMSRGECAALVIGGYSLTAYGFQRQTADIDLLVATPNSESVGTLLARAGYRETKRNDTSACYIHNNLLHLPVDLVFVNSATWDKMWPLSEEAMIEGCKVRVPAPGHLIALKLHAMKQNPGGREQDFGDIARIFRNRQSQVPRDVLQSLCEQYGPVGIFAKLESALNDAH